MFVRNKMNCPNCGLSATTFDVTLDFERKAWCGTMHFMCTVCSRGFSAEINVHTLFRIVEGALNCAPIDDFKHIRKLIQEVSCTESYDKAWLHNLDSVLLYASMCVFIPNTFRRPLNESRILEGVLSYFTEMPTRKYRVSDRHLLRTAGL